MELKFCEKCYQMTNHGCLKCATQHLPKVDVLAEVRAILKELNSIGPRINAHWCFGECSAGEEFCPREYCLDEKISELYKKVSEHFS